MLFVSTHLQHIAFAHLSEHRTQQKQRAAAITQHKKTRHKNNRQAILT
jgi:hypothetical protein